MVWKRQSGHSERSTVSVRRLAFPSTDATWDVVHADSLRPGDAILLYDGEPAPVEGVVVAVDDGARVVQIVAP